MTDLPFVPTHRDPTVLDRAAGSLLAVLLAMAVGAALPEWRSQPSDPTPVEVWHGNAASFHPAP